jgi:hypothetical protein
LGATVFETALITIIYKEAWFVIWVAATAILLHIFLLIWMRKDWE